MNHTPVAAAEFASLMARLGPFEAQPAVAVAVSGGPDSMALALLAQAWAQARGGGAIGLTVDHGLRAGSAAEALRVGEWLCGYGMAHHVLHWRGPRPRANVQAVARAARYELLEGRCRREGVLHLLLAHHRDDQAETFLLRLGRGSGVDGLAAMAPLAERGGVRLLRPLLAVPGTRLAACLRAAGQNWIEDPANKDEAYARVRARAALPHLAAEGMTPARLAATASNMGRARSALERATAELLACAVALSPSGHAWLDAAALAAAPSEIGLRALAGVLRTVGGAAYPPRLRRLRALCAALRDGPPFKGRTLAGCRILAAAGGADRLLLCREPAAAVAAVPVHPGARVLWDGRFALEFGRAGGGFADGVVVRRLGRSGWAQVVAMAPDTRGAPIPAPARPALPALWRGDRVLGVPHFRFWCPGADFPPAALRRIGLLPPRALTSTVFAVV
jgi:tRNA(Ile)-lysidine synthase